MRKPKPQQTFIPGCEPQALERRKPVTPQARAMTGGRNRVAPAPKPWLCAVLAVDTADRSGFATYVQGKLVEYGEVETRNAKSVERVVQDALTAAGSLPLVLVLEFRWGGYVHVTAALRVACDRWRAVWVANNQAMARIHKVQPRQWRGPVLGSYYASNAAGREEVRKAEQSMAKGLVGLPAKAEIGPDAAAAILIGRWAMHAPEVGDCAGKRAVKKSQQAWGVRGA